MCFAMYQIYEIRICTLKLCTILSLEILEHMPEFTDKIVNEHDCLVMQLTGLRTYFPTKEDIHIL